MHCNNGRTVIVYIVYLIALDTNTVHLIVTQALLRQRLKRILICPADFEFQREVGVERPCTLLYP